MKNKKRNINKKIKFKNIVIILVLIFASCSLIFSIVKIIIWYRDINKSIKQIDNINNLTDIENIEEQKELSIYEKYFKMDMINVDFSELKKLNPDTRGWIFINGTQVNYPFVQKNNNDFYLTHSFDKSYNQAGWLFLDYRNNIDNMDKNTIIYGHKMKDNKGIMFGTLTNILKKEWYTNSKNHIIKISTPSSNTLWQVFSVYKIPTTSDYLQINFNNDSEYQDFINLLKGRSIYNFNTSINTNDKILTLSTCYSEKEKVVLHALLIKEETR